MTNRTRPTRLPAWALALLVVGMAAVTATAGAAEPAAVPGAPADGNFAATTFRNALPQAAPAEAVSPPEALARPVTWAGNQLPMMIILTLAAVTMFALMLTFIARSPGHSADNLVTGGGMVVVVFGALLLILMADTQEQLTATVGLLGAVAGYLFRSALGPLGGGGPHGTHPPPGPNPAGPKGP